MCCSLPHSWRNTFCLENQKEQETQEEDEEEEVEVEEEEEKKKKEAAANIGRQKTEQLK
jgi:hypothetical protein